MNLDRPVIQAIHLEKRFSSGTNSVVALADLDLEIQPGERVSIIGRSGSGKTTLLNLLAGLDRPTAGQLIVDNQDLSTLSSPEMALYRQNSVGVIFQSFQLIPHRTAAQNVELPLIIRGDSPNTRMTRVEESLERVGLKHRLSHFPFQMSGGEQQRVAVARALVNEPAILLADEPTGNLDSQTTDEIIQLLLHVADESALTLILVTHDLELANTYSQRHIKLQDGRIIEELSHEAH